MNTASAAPAGDEEKMEQGPVKIDLKAKLKEFIGQRLADERKLFEEAVWEDPDREWRATDKKWEVGFLEYVSKRVMKEGRFDPSIFNEYLKKLKKRYENTSQSQEPELKKFCKAQMEIGQKILGLYSTEHAKEDQAKNDQMERLKNIYSWKNILFTMRNIRRQVFELFLGKGKDPFFDYSQLQKGEAQLTKQATGANGNPNAGVKESSATSSAEPRARQSSKEPTIFEQFLEKKHNKGGGSSRSAEPPAPPMDQAA